MVQKQDIIDHATEWYDRRFIRYEHHGKLEYKWCENGHGNKHPLRYSPETGTLHCYACRRTFSIFQIYAMDNELDCRKDFARICNGLAEEIGLADTGCVPVNKPIRVAPQQPPKKPLTADYIRWNNSLLTDPKPQQALLRRGISGQTAKRFLLGYDNDEIIIPVSATSYVRWRPFRTNLNSPKYLNSLGGVELFGTKFAEQANTVWLVEGAFDALSVYEVGGTAIATLGAAGMDKALQWAISHPDKYFVIATDNDTAGKAFATQLSDGLQGKVQFTVETLPYKDCNDWLQGNRLTLRQEVVAVKNFYSAIKDFYSSNSQNCDIMVRNYKKSTACATNTSGATAIQSQPSELANHIQA